jgi:phospholipid/cholesterol/gamma-HCH transport system ATP-binding protein
MTQMNDGDASSPQGSVASRCFVELEGIHKAFGSNKVLRGVDLSVQHGKVLTILGGSGSGKSVLLKHMIGLLHPDRGRVEVDGRDMTELAERDWIDTRKGIGYVFQGAALFDSINVYENVAYPLREHLSWGEDEIARRVAESLEAVALVGVEKVMPADLSGGMRKRVGVARGIALRPQAILYDEPTTGLDPANSRRIGGLISSLQEQLHMTSVVVTHEIDLCLAISDRIVLLRDGKLVMDVTPDEFKSENLPMLREFLGEEDLDQGAGPTNRQGEIDGG